MQNTLKLNRLFKIGLLATTITILPGCDFVSGLIAFSCVMSGDETHCYQDAAVQSGNADDCEKVTQKEEFKKAGSNPPKDKCLLMVAENTENPAVCSKVEGGLMSYTQDECYKNVSESATKPATCQNMPGQYTEDCANKLGEKTYTSIQQRLNNNPSPEELQKIQKLMEDMSNLYGTLSNTMKSQHDLTMTAVRNFR